MKTKKQILIVLLSLLTTTAYTALDWNITEGTNSISETDEYGTVRVYDEAILNMADGQVSTIVGYNQSTVTISEGVISNSLRSEGNNVTTIINGNIRSLSASDNGVVTIYGGIFETVGATQHGVLHLCGGTIQRDLTAYDYSHIHVYGYDLSVNGKSLSGIWENGESFNIYMRYIEPTVTITLHEIPEPATMLLLGLGGLLIRRKRLEHQM